MKEILKLSRDVACEIVEGESDEFHVIHEEITGTARWSIINRSIVKRVSDGKFFSTVYRTPATESQDEKPFEYTDPVFTEVIPVQKTITVYE